jgi:cobalamin synthase
LGAAAAAVAPADPATGAVATAAVTDSSVAALLLAAAAAAAAASIACCLRCSKASYKGNKQQASSTEPNKWNYSCLCYNLASFQAAPNQAPFVDAVYALTYLLLTNAKT